MIKAIIFFDIFIKDPPLIFYGFITELPADNSALNGCLCSDRHGDFRAVFQVNQFVIKSVYTVEIQYVST
jgi:hypothetical protein